VNQFLSPSCQLNGIDPFHYLTELLRHAQQLAAAPQDWMPWNYRDTLAAVRAPPGVCGVPAPIVAAPATPVSSAR
jgi:hypothetical protein